MKDEKRVGDKSLALFYAGNIFGGAALSEQYFLWR
jgi:hypothetical protein